MTPLDSIKYSLQNGTGWLYGHGSCNWWSKAWVVVSILKPTRTTTLTWEQKDKVGKLTIKPFSIHRQWKERGFHPETEVDNGTAFRRIWLVPSGRKCGRYHEYGQCTCFLKTGATAYIMKQVARHSSLIFLKGSIFQRRWSLLFVWAPGDLHYMKVFGVIPCCWQGFSTKPYMISRIEDRNGNVIKVLIIVWTEKKWSVNTAYTMCRMMQGTGW